MVGVKGKSGRHSRECCCDKCKTRNELKANKTPVTEVKETQPEITQQV